MNTTHLREELSNELYDLLHKRVSNKALDQVDEIVHKVIKKYEQALEIDSQFDDLFKIKK